MDKLWRNRDWLYEHYIARKKSMSAMAKEAGCSYATINYWLHELGVTVRSRGEGVFLANRNSVIIIPGLFEFMRGEILGDGYVGMMGNRSALYRHTSKYKEYVVWLSNLFDKRGIGQAGRITRHKDKRGIISYRYASKSYPELVPFVKEWYTKRDGKMKKTTVPEDLKLTPIMARQWYLGDGGLSSYKIKRPGIVFGTYDFDHQSVEYLVKELNGLGFKATRQPSNNTIRIWVRSAQDFLSWIGPCPISCYDYKWDYEKHF